MCAVLWWWILLSVNDVQELRSGWSVFRGTRWPEDAATSAMRGDVQGLPTGSSVQGLPLQQPSPAAASLHVRSVVKSARCSARQVVRFVKSDTLGVMRQ